MKITKLGSATVLIEANNTNILCDPWLIDGAYYGSWCNFPPIDIKKNDLDNIDYVYVSHIHPDHFDVRTIQLIDKKVPFIIHSYHKKFLKSNIERLGYKVIELENGKEMQLDKKTKISVYAADNCDPKICGRMFGCISGEINGSMQIDSLCVINDGNHILVNTNDCPYEIAKKTLAEVKKKYKEIDFLLTGYTSASLYPHCMMSYSEDKMINGIKKAKMKGLNSGLGIIKMLKPKFFMPFAGTYILGGSYYKKNKFIPLPELQDAVEYFNSNNEISSSTAVMLNYKEFFDISSAKVSKKYRPVDVNKRKEYIQEIASKFKYTFEEKEMPTNQSLMDLFQKAVTKLKQKQEEINFYENIDLVFDIDSNQFIKINLLDTTPTYIKDISNLSNYHRFKLDTRLLELVLKGPQYANWNNIEIGAMLEFDRKPDNFRQDIHILMNALHL